MALTPLKNSFLFVFLNYSRDGTFVNRNKGNVIIVSAELESQGHLGRWGKVLSVGKDVEDFDAGDVVLISPGKWTTGFKYDDQMIWKSDDSWVLGVGTEDIAYEHASKPAF